MDGIFFSIFIPVVVFYLIASIRILKQYERGVVFLLGNSKVYAGRG
jgi:regulator of protease activity HflC (stomatin/prohibitin superfamily)